MEKLPEFLEFVKEVQCFVVAALKSNGVERKGKIDEKPRTPRETEYISCISNSLAISLERKNSNPNREGWRCL